MKRKLRKKLGIALGSGSARGWSHIGVFNALDEAGVTVDFISGTSIGSVVGAVYSLGNISELEKFARGINWKSIVSYIDITFPGSSGLVPGKRLFKMLSEYYKENMIEDLPIPFCAVAADVNTGEEVRFSSGRVVDSVRASVAIPGVLTPFEYEGRFLVDGAIVNPVPVNIVREMGADVVIAVDLNSCIIEDGAKSSKKLTSARDSSSKHKKIKDEERDKRIFEMLEEKYREFTGSFKGKFGSFRPKKHHPNILEILDRTTHIMQRSITENQFRISLPEIVIEPQLGDFRLFDFDRAEEAIEEGYRLTKDRIEDIKKLLL